MQQYIIKCKYADKNTKNLTVGFYLQALENGFFQIDFFFFLIALVKFCYFLYYLYCCNLRLIFSAKVFAFQRKNLILHTLLSIGRSLQQLQPLLLTMQD